ncbi:hypothetical protein AB0L40_19560 [Patulibacter sp. NPDC049589]|uniref:hypothetical protein n=1 Tax=Patulibacter sp. NPDC049589 TaxID=3154731 RepID=UPI00341BD4CE
MFSPPLLMRHRLRHFTVRPWDDAFGEAGHPEVLLGTAVAEIIRVRTDGTAALVQLADRRHAMTGAILAVGGRTDLRRYANRRGAQSDDLLERQWYVDCAYLLSNVRGPRRGAR